MKAICRSCGQELELEICPTEQDLKENPSLDAFEKCWIYPQHWYQGYWCDESGCYVANYDNPLIVVSMRPDSFENNHD